MRPFVITQLVKVIVLSFVIVIVKSQCRVYGWKDDVIDGWKEYPCKNGWNHHSVECCPSYPGSCSLGRILLHHVEELSLGLYVGIEEQNVPLSVFHYRRKVFWKQTINLGLCTRAFSVEIQSYLFGIFDASSDRPSHLPGCKECDVSVGQFRHIAHIFHHVEESVPHLLSPIAVLGFNNFLYELFCLFLL